MRQEDAIELVVKDCIAKRAKQQATISLTKADDIKHLFSRVAYEFDYKPEDIELHYQQEDAKVSGICIFFYVVCRFNTLLDS